MTRIKFVFATALLMLLATSATALCCTTMIITKGASADGSMMVAHSDDDELGDQRFILVPARPQQGKRQIFAEHYRYPRISTKERGPAYDTGAPYTKPLYELPYKDIWAILGHEVPRSYAYYDGAYGIMNEHNLMLGECTNGAYYEPGPNNGDKPGPMRLFYSSELSRIALENCKTARDAITLMGGLIDKYGFYSTGETLLVADPDEAWVFEMCALGDQSRHSAWVAQRVPDGMVFVAANEFRIRGVDFKDKKHKNFYWSKHLPKGCIQTGHWDGKTEFDWLRAVSPGEYNHPYYSLRRVWRVLDRVNPDLGLSPWVRDGYTTAYPFAVSPKTKLTPHDVFALYRDHYEGTQFDLTKGVAAGPYGDPHRFVGPYDNPQNDISDSSTPPAGAWERAISVFYQGYTFVCQWRPNAPEMTQGLVWHGPDVSYTTCFAPFFAKASNLNPAYSSGSPQKLDRKAAWWAFDYVNSLSRLNFQRMTRNDILPLQQELERESFEFVANMDKIMVDPPKSAPLILGQKATANSNRMLKRWWDLGDMLIAKYADGYINLPNGRYSEPAPGTMPIEVGYPSSWLDKTNYRQGPTTYDMK